MGRVTVVGRFKVLPERQELRVVEEVIRKGKTMYRIACVEAGCRNTRLVPPQNLGEVVRCVGCQKRHRNVLRRKGAKQ